MREVLQGCQVPNLEVIRLDYLIYFFSTSSRPERRTSGRWVKFDQPRRARRDNSLLVSNLLGGDSDCGCQFQTGLDDDAGAEARLRPRLFVKILRKA